MAAILSRPQCVKQKYTSIHSKYKYFLPDSIVTWASRRLRSPTPRLFVQQIVRANTKENTKAPYHRPFIRGMHRPPVDSPQKGSVSVSISWRHRASKKCRLPLGVLYVQGLMLCELVRIWRAYAHLFSALRVFCLVCTLSQVLLIVAKSDITDNYGIPSFTQSRWGCIWMHSSKNGSNFTRESFVCSNDFSSARQHKLLVHYLLYVRRRRITSGLGGEGR